MRTVSSYCEKARSVLLGAGTFTVLGALLLVGCKKPIADAPPEAPPEISTATPTPTTPTPAPPTPEPRVAAATPAPNYTAPLGVYFLVAKASVETGDGITGLLPGTQLQQTGPMEYLAPGGHKLTLRPDQVTNDLRIARHMAGADTAAQNALRKMQAARPHPTAATASATPTPAPRTSAAPPAPRPTASIGGSGALGASHSRVKDGFIWEKDRNGVWQRIRPVR